MARSDIAARFSLVTFLEDFNVKNLRIAPLIGAMLLAVSAFVFSLQPATVASAANAVPIQYTATVDFASAADAVGETVSVVAPGAALGDGCTVSLLIDLQDMLLTCYVQAANTVELRLQNESAGTVNLASTTARIYLLKPRLF